MVEYLGRYTHKIAISNNRIQNIDNENVTFKYKDYKLKWTKKQMTLSQGEYSRRFAMHILPTGFVKIRHYGFLSSTWKRQKLKDLQRKLKVQLATKPNKESKVKKCPCCKTGNLHTISIIDTRNPPPEVSGWFLGDSQMAKFHHN